MVVSSSIVFFDFKLLEGIVVVVVVIVLLVLVFFFIILLLLLVLVFDEIFGLLDTIFGRDLFFDMDFNERLDLDNLEFIFLNEFVFDFKEVFDSDFVE